MNPLPINNLSPFHYGQEVICVEEPATILRAKESVFDVISQIWFVTCIVPWEPNRPFELPANRLRAVSRGRETMRKHLRVVGGRS